MPPRNAPKRRPSPDVLPDSLPKRGEEPDILPDDLRRTDQPETTPDSLPRRGDPATTDTRPDGGVAQHPVHDSDVEDKDAEDIEDEIDDAPKMGFEPTSDESQDIADAADEFDEEELGPRSIPARDRDR
jgi:hypothetical protein